MKNITQKQKLILFCMADDYYDAWRDILSKKQLSEKLFRHLGYTIGYPSQLTQVRLGIQNGLSDEQIRTFAKRNLSPKQMEKLRLLCESGMSCKLVELLANPRYSVEIMGLIEQVFLDGYCAPTTAVKLITNPYFSFSQSEKIACHILSRLPSEKIKFYAKPEFTPEQMQAIFLGFANELSVEQVSLYAKPEFNDKQMYEIARGLLDMPRSIEKIQLYARPEYNACQMAVIRKGLERRLPKEHLMLYAKPDFTFEQMEEIFRAHLFNLTIEEIQMYANPKYSTEKMRQMRKDIVCNKQANNLLEILKNNY